MSRPQGFSGQPILRPYLSHEGTRLWTLMDHFYYTDAARNIWWAPKGMLTDLASVPDLVDGFFAGVDLRAPGVMHDARYLLSPVTGEKRGQLDDLFVEMAVHQGATGFQAWAADRGLLLGGWHSWGECQALGVRWTDFDTSALTASEIAEYRVRWGLDRERVQSGKQEAVRVA